MFQNVSAPVRLISKVTGLLSTRIHNHPDEMSYIHFNAMELRPPYPTAYAEREQRRKSKSEFKFRAKWHSPIHPAPRSFFPFVRKTCVNEKMRLRSSNAELINPHRETFSHVQSRWGVSTCLSLMERIMWDIPAVP